jgi:hypothetical protein
MTASIVAAAILVAGTLVLPYSYAMARHLGNFTFKSIDVRKSVDSIKQKEESLARGGSAPGVTRPNSPVQIVTVIDEHNFLSHESAATIRR